MDAVYEPKTEALRALFWRQEIMQLLLWIEGEGFGHSIELVDLKRYLGREPARGRRYLEELVAEGFLVRHASAYRLSSFGRQFSLHLLAPEFRRVSNPIQGECGVGCWCHLSTDEADFCAERRTA